jgi:hypothetical protein
MNFRPALIRTIKLTAAIVTGVLGGCGQSITLQVDSEVPAALVQTLPLTVGVYYDEEFRNHRYTEDSIERPNWVIDTGMSQVAMFDQVFISTFESVIPLEKPPTADAPVEFDLVVVPKIVEIQFATPRETFFDSYEAWIRYDIDMRAADGRSIDHWEITAYGKAPKTRFGTRKDGLNDAIGLALRDAGAKLSTGMRDQSVIKRLLEVKR